MLTVLRNDEPTATRAPQFCYGLGWDGTRTRYERRRTGRCSCENGHARAQRCDHAGHQSERQRSLYLKSIPGAIAAHHVVDDLGACKNAWNIRCAHSHRCIDNRFGGMPVHPIEGRTDKSSASRTARKRSVLVGTIGEPCDEKAVTNNTFRYRTGAAGIPEIGFDSRPSHDVGIAWG